MTQAHTTQTFFTPPRVSSHQETLPATTYNLAHILLNRFNQPHLFIPIRSMQYLAIIEPNCFWFVDSMAYAVQDNEGGRLITVSWHPTLSAQQRDGIQQHMDCSVHYYQQDQSVVQTRLRGEFLQAMKVIDKRYRDRIKPSAPLSIINMRPAR